MSLVQKSVQFIYINKIRPMIPRSSPINYNGVSVQARTIADRLVPIQLPVNHGGHPNPSEYEAGMVVGTKRIVTEGDTVVVIGGGMGVTTVHAAKQAGSSGKVIVYEGAANQIGILQDTIRKNGVADIIDVRHSIVGEAFKLEGSAKGASIIPPNEIVECDSLIMDCEGAEVGMLQGLTFTPKLVVETHGNREKVVREIEELGLKIESEEVAEPPPLQVELEENGVFVLTAK